MFRPVNLCRVALLVALCCAPLLYGCASPEQKRQQSVKKLQDFCALVTKQLLDRNPDTVKESFSRVMREDSTEKAVEKMQELGFLPHSEIGEDKIIDDAQDKHLVHTIIVKQATPMSPIDRLPITFRVEGVIQDQKDGHPAGERPFSYTLTCNLIEDDFGQVVDIGGQPPGGAPKTATEAKPNEKPKEKRRKRRH